MTTLSTLSGSEHDGALHGYVQALQLVFIGVAVPSSALCSISTMLVKNRSLIQPTNEKASDIATPGDEHPTEK